MRTEGSIRDQCARRIAGRMIVRMHVCVEE